MTLLAAAFLIWSGAPLAGTTTSIDGSWVPFQVLGIFAGVSYVAALVLAPPLRTARESRPGFASVWKQ